MKFCNSRNESILCTKIAQRAVALAVKHGIKYKMMDASMDIEAAHCNGNPLRLADLLEADDFNFAHDVFGIRRHIDRETGKLGDCFSPRYTERQIQATA